MKLKKLALIGILTFTVFTACTTETETESKQNQTQLDITAPVQRAQDVADDINQNYDGGVSDDYTNLR